MQEKVRTEISGELLESYAYFARITVRRNVEGHASEEVFAPGLNIRALLDYVEAWQRKRDVEPLSDEEAMGLAVEEQHASRREN
jgi:hypothetical protein